MSFRWLVCSLPAHKYRLVSRICFFLAGGQKEASSSSSSQEVRRPLERLVLEPLQGPARVGPFWVSAEIGAPNKHGGVCPADRARGRLVDVHLPPREGAKRWQSSSLGLFFSDYQMSGPMSWSWPSSSSAAAAAAAAAPWGRLECRHDSLYNLITATLAALGPLPPSIDHAPMVASGGNNNKSGQ